MWSVERFLAWHASEALGPYEKFMAALATLNDTNALRERGVIHT